MTGLSRTWFAAWAAFATARAQRRQGSATRWAHRAARWSAKARGEAIKEEGERT